MRPGHHRHAPVLAGILLAAAGAVRPSDAAAQAQVDTRTHADPMDCRSICETPKAAPGQQDGADHPAPNDICRWSDWSDLANRQVLWQKFEVARRGYQPANTLVTVPQYVLQALLAMTFGSLAAYSVARTEGHDSLRHVTGYMASIGAIGTLGTLSWYGIERLGDERTEKRTGLAEFELGYARCPP